MKERLELVTDFASLRAGMIVVDTHCAACGRRNCRGILTTLTALEPDEEDPAGGFAWEYAPDCKPEDRDPVHFRGIAPSTVAQGRIYRVIDGLESSTTISKRKSVRT